MELTVKVLILFAALRRTRLTSYVSDPQIVELLPAVYVKLGNALEVVVSGSNTYRSMLEIVEGETIAVRQGSMTATPTILHVTHEVGLAVTHATTFKL